MTGGPTRDGLNANGYVTAMPDGSTFAYDVKNRVVSNGAAYDPQNRRVWDGSSLYLYGTDGNCSGFTRRRWIGELHDAGAVECVV